MANKMKREVSQRANSNVFMYNSSYKQVRTSLSKCLIKDKFIFDTEDIIGTFDTKDYINFIGLKKAYEITKQIGELLYLGEINMKSLKARNWRERDCVLIQTKYYPQYFNGKDIYLKAAAIKGKWIVVLHE